MKKKYLKNKLTSYYNRLKRYNYKRAVRFFWQRRTRGWDDSETWNLFYTMATALLPRLKRFREITCAYPCEFDTIEEWQQKLDVMIEAFEIIVSDDLDYSEAESNKVKAGLDLFRKYYFDLWW